MKSSHILILLTLLALASCGNGGGGNGGNNASQSEVSPENIKDATAGTYYTVLRPVNFHSNGFIPYGMATFTLKGDQLQASISLDDDQPVTHRQSLHLGTRCPTLADDANGDGFVDYDEAQRVVGPALMPLDSDISSQVSGAESYPRGPAMTYNKMASLAKINADLWNQDEDPTDNVIKLAQGNGIGFEGRVVLVHGTSPRSNFPASLASYRGEPSHLSLPVVCGVLTQIE